MLVTYFSDDNIWVVFGDGATQPSSYPLTVAASGLARGQVMLTLRTHPLQLQPKKKKTAIRQVIKCIELL